MIGNRFVKFDPAANGKSKFEQLLDLFMQLLTYTSGDVNEALQWMNELDKKYQLTDDESILCFILLNKKFILKPIFYFGFFFSK